MPVETRPVDLPLYVGRGEGKDDQNRTQSAVTSTNVSFEKDGSVATREILSPIGNSLDGSPLRVLPTKKDVFVASPTSLYKIDGDELSLRTSLAQEYVPENIDLPVGRKASSWPRQVRMGDKRLLVWLEPSAVGTFAPYYQTFDLEGIPTGPVRSVSLAVPPNYSLVRVSDTQALLVTGSVTTDQVVITPLNFVIDDFVAGANVTQTTAGGAIQYTQAEVFGPTSVYIISYCNPTDNTQSFNAGETRRTFYDPSTGTISSSSVLGLPYSASAGTHLAKNPVTGDIWAVIGDYASGRVAVYNSTTNSVPVALTGLDYAPQANMGSGLGTVLTNGASGFFPTRHWDGRLVFSGNLAFVAFHGVTDITDANNELVAWGTELHFIGSVPQDSVWRRPFPHCHLYGDPWVRNGRLEVPVVSSSPWLTEISGSGTTDRTVPTISECQALLGSLGFTPQGLPPYAVGYLASANATTGADPRTHSAFALDEATNQSGIVHEFVGSVPSNPPPTPTAHILVGGSSDPVSFELFHPRRTAARLIGFGGRGTTSGGVLKEGWGNSLHATAFTRVRTLEGVATTESPVLNTGLVSILEGRSILPSAIPVPPLPMVGRFVGTGGGVRQREYQFLFAFIDANGTRHRGPLSHVYIGGFEAWDADTDSTSMEVLLPPQFPELQSAGNWVLEVYANPVDEGTVDTASRVLIDTIQIDNGQSVNVVVNLETTQAGLPFPYTTGGVLPNEARSAGDSVLFAAGRVWTFEGSRVYFSKQVGKDRPLAFNGNLFFDSPDGSSFTGIGQMDEQVILFTRSSVYQVRGQLPNDKGTNTNAQLYNLSTPSGCLSPGSVLSTELGVFFQGDRGIHLVQRNFSIIYLGDSVEDSLALSGGLVSWADYDRDRKEARFGVQGNTFILDTRTQLWTREVYEESIDHVAWTPGDSYWTSGDRVYRKYPQVLDPETKSELLGTPLLSHSTPWISLQSLQGYQSVRTIAIQGKISVLPNVIPESTSGQVTTPARQEANRDGIVRVELYNDHKTTPFFTRDYTFPEGETSPMEIDIHVSRQRSRAMRVQVRTISENNISLRITSIVAQVGVLPGGDKRLFNPAGTQ